ncbi:unnamed protein product, partial [Iphiclides podalirius]
MTEMDKSIDGIARDMSELNLLSFRKLDDVKRLAKHFRYVINHPSTQECAVVHRYLSNLDQLHKSVFLSKRDGVEVEYIFTTEKKSSLQRQRFNSLPVSEVPELLKAEFLTVDNAKQVHICTECDVEIELCDDTPLVECLQKHFSSDAHLPKLKRESIDVAEPIALPKMSRRLSALESGDNHNAEQIIQLLKPVERLDRTFTAVLEAAFVRLLADKSEASIDAAMRFYQEAFDKLCKETNTIDFSTQTGSVAPIIMSIRDNVNQNFAADANRNFESEDTEQVPERPAKNAVKKYRYYGPIESITIKLLLNHKLLTLVDDRTGKLAFFCAACEYYTLRFRYDSVLGHVFSDTHVHNLACIMQADRSIPFSAAPTMERVRELNVEFLRSHYVNEEADGAYCALCKLSFERESIVAHVLDEGHLGRLSDKLYRKMRASNPDGSVPEEWGPKSLDWTKFLASVGKPLSGRDHVVVENFIRPSGKVANYCSCCDMTLKGPRQVLFNHIRQKKHLRNAAPHKLSTLYRNHCRPSEYYASFGNYYLCAVCPEYVAVPSFAAIVEHFESAGHVEAIAKLVRSALGGEVDEGLLSANGIRVADWTCERCSVPLADAKEAVHHVLSSVQHQSAAAEARARANRGDIIAVYMRGNYVLHSDGATFHCAPCDSTFSSIRSLLMHLVYAEHFDERPAAEGVFRFYLELKHNVAMLARNRYAYSEFGTLRCGVCDAQLAEGENAKRHVMSPRHKESMGAGYASLGLDAANME